MMQRVLLILSRPCVSPTEVKICQTHLQFNCSLIL